ncbi:hypothetical protein LY01_02152 [Nonlabens xylanidelens]|uniref:Uncharacterized protein n=1 Tax=Nonlabens xylanidelens TaxID=191564 RepID=A0A2S6IIC8_9FLAO|nr:hypothetical protein [Nonlabens xylanidelens]PPK93930.1 hypothetical protein LY01_02152 [Nonlabens xylanidelens]PQJ22086.1 hypothetical protein BST94_00475 [Nonlabens xylanidelens]
MKIETEIELEQWMKSNCYTFNSYSINGSFIHNGFGLDNNGGLYSWYYTERGERRTLKYFKTEEEAVNYAFDQIKSDQYANRNYIGMIKEKHRLNEIISELKKRNIEYWTDEIPYGGFEDMRTRIFVIGCDIKKVADISLPK